MKAWMKAWVSLALPKDASTRRRHLRQPIGGRANHDTFDAVEPIGKPSFSRLRTKGGSAGLSLGCYGHDMSRTLLGVLCGAILFAALIYTTLRDTEVSCEVCIEFEGRSACNTAAGPDVALARMQATSGACASLSSGVTNSIRCNSTPPASVQCLE
jgi:hypothetical protein